MCAAFGTWDHSPTVRIYDNAYVSACANCHWDGNDARSNDERVENMEPTESQSLLDKAHAAMENLTTHDITMDDIAKKVNEISSEIIHLCYVGAIIITSSVEATLESINRLMMAMVTAVQ